ncbi:MAG: SDR family NAD(P)-dependent oxidoreductase [Pseudomonadota bacterium]|nr:SDR family NAD(P)-dependent oxidoreductase [Pseudomonadota bacterium]
MLDPQGRVVMVSGANRGIGLAIAQCLQDKGYSLSLGARDTASFDADMAGETVMTHAYDATDATNNAAWVAATMDRFGHIDGLVNNAGISRSANIEDADEDAFDAMWAVNAKGPMRMIRLALPHLRASGSGRVVNVVSLSGKRVANIGTGYAMSKFAMMAVSHAARRAAWDDGVRVTALCPSYVATDMTAGRSEPPPEEMIQPADLAELAAVALALPNTAAMAEMLVSCRFDAMI